MNACQFCGQLFESKKRGRPAKCCSRKCQMDLLYLKEKKSAPESVERICKNCGKGFVKLRSSQRKTCSAACLKHIATIKNCLVCHKQISYGATRCAVCAQIGKVPWNKKFADPKTAKQIRRLREQAATGLTPSERKNLLKVWKSQNLSCSYCFNLCDTVDHVVPLVRGGSNQIGNLVPACRKCNSSKGSKLIVEWKHHARPTA